VACRRIPRGSVSSLTGLRQVDLLWGGNRKGEDLLQQIAALPVGPLRSKAKLKRMLTISYRLGLLPLPTGALGRRCGPKHPAANLSISDFFELLDVLKISTF
jgi:hypothetical protein